MTPEQAATMRRHPSLASHELEPSTILRLRFQPEAMALSLGMNHEEDLVNGKPIRRSDCATAGVTVFVTAVLHVSHLLRQEKPSVRVVTDIDAPSRLRLCKRWRVN
jgi:hypothetical protein